MDSIDALIIGGGVVGLACARRMALSGMSTIVLDSEFSFGQGASSRNSEVIHAGLYYQTNSIKAKLCLEGRELLYKYCQSRNIKHKNIGKWIVANTPKQIKQLEFIAQNAKRNGCNEVYWVDIENAKKEEPELIAKKILASPRTGIIDSHEYMLSLLADIEANNGILVTNSRVLSGRACNDQIIVKIESDKDYEIKAKYVVNSAGLNAISLAKKFNSLNIPSFPERGFCKGNYFSLSGIPPFSKLIYPTPEPGGLGIHFTLDLNGQAKFGPDVEWVNKIDYGVNEERRINFINQISSYWKGIDESRLSPDYSGIRAKISANNSFSDFIISTEKENGIKGLVNLYGIESPGLTASLAIANQVIMSLVD